MGPGAYRTKRKNVGPLTEPGWVISFGLAPSRIAPMSETVFQDRNGRVPRTLEPRGPQPYSRHMPVLQKDSSMKTSRLSGRPASARRRRAGAPGCAGCRALPRRRTFFSRVPEPHERPLNGRPARRKLLRLPQRGRHLRHGGVGHRGHERLELRLDLPRSGEGCRHREPAARASRSPGSGGGSDSRSRCRPRRARRSRRGCGPPAGAGR